MSRDQNTREHRVDKIGPMREMHRAEGYVMARRPGKFPFVMTLAEWASYPILEPTPLPAPGPKINVKEFVEKL